LIKNKPSPLPVSNNNLTSLSPIFTGMEGQGFKIPIEIS